jgi:hypothetical protein
MKTITDIRPSPIAGQWYPGDAKKLAHQVDSYIAAAGEIDIIGQIIGIIAPHAGHRYSGRVAGHAFAPLRGLKPQLVAVISPLHYPHPAPLVTSAHQAYSTPLGILPIDLKAVDQLKSILEGQHQINLASVSNDPEHSLEIELPFLQRVFDHEYTLLPVMVRDQEQTVVNALGHALAIVLSERDSLLVASTDLSHFYPQTIANQLDQAMLQRIEAFDPQGVLQVEEEGKGFACGRGAVAAALIAARELGATSVKVLNYATSGDVTGDFSSVVGYGAAVIIRSE